MDDEEQLECEEIIVEDGGEFPNDMVVEEVVLQDNSYDDDAMTLYEDNGTYYMLQDGNYVEVVESPEGFYESKEKNQRKMSYEYDGMGSDEPSTSQGTSRDKMKEQYIYKMNGERPEDDQEEYEVEVVDDQPNEEILLDDGQYVDGGTIETEMPIRKYEPRRERKIFNDTEDRRCFGCRQELPKDKYYEHVRMISNYGSCNPAECRKFACNECEECMATIEKLCEHMFLNHDAPTQIQIREFATDDEFDMFVILMENSGSLFSKARSSKRLRKGVVQFFRCDYRTYGTGADADVEEPCTAFITKMCQVNGKIEARYCTHHLHNDDVVHVPLKVKTRLYEMALKRLPPVVAHKVVMKEISNFCSQGSRIEARLKKLTVENVIAVVSSLLKKIEDRSPRPSGSYPELAEGERLNNMLNNILDNEENGGDDFLEEIEVRDLVDQDPHQNGEGKGYSQGNEEGKGDDGSKGDSSHQEEFNDPSLDPQPCFADLGPDFRYNPMAGRDAKIIDLNENEQHYLDEFEEENNIQLNEEQSENRVNSRKRQTITQMLRLVSNLEDMANSPAFAALSSMNPLIKMMFRAEDIIEEACELESEWQGARGNDVDPFEIKKHLVKPSKMRQKIEHYRSMVSQGIEKPPPGDEEIVEDYVAERFKEMVLANDFFKRGRPGREREHFMESDPFDRRESQYVVDASTIHHDDDDDDDEDETVNIEDDDEYGRMIADTLIEKMEKAKRPREPSADVLVDVQAIDDDENEPPYVQQPCSSMEIEPDRSTSPSPSPSLPKRRGRPPKKPSSVRLTPKPRAKRQKTKELTPEVVVDEEEEEEIVLEQGQEDTTIEQEENVHINVVDEDDEDEFELNDDDIVKEEPEYDDEEYEQSAQPTTRTGRTVKPRRFYDD